MIALIDTSALVAVVSPRDQHHREASAYALTSGLQLRTNAVILAETYTFLRSRFDYAFAMQTVGRLKASEAVKIYPWSAELDDAVYGLLHEFAGVPMSYADASLVVLGRELRINDVFSFDSDLGMAGLTLRPT